jgi:hypothetical protein
VPEEIRLLDADMAVLPLLIEQGRVYKSEELLWNNVVIPVYTITGQGLLALYLDEIVRKPTPN